MLLSLYIAMLLLYAVAVWLFGSLAPLAPLCSSAPLRSALFLLEAQIRRWRVQRELGSARALHRAPRLRAAQSAALHQSTAARSTEHCAMVVVSWRSSDGSAAEVQYRMSLLSKELLAKSLGAEEAGAGGWGWGPCPASKAILYLAPHVTPCQSPYL